MFVHALSGAASFAACLRLFRSYPLALNPSYPGDPGPTSARHAAGWRGSIVLRHRGFDEPGFYVLSQHPAEHFTLRPWRAGDGEFQEIRPGTPVPVASHRIVTEGMPVPREGALLGWVTDRQVTALLTVRHGAGRAGRKQTARRGGPACLRSACSPWWAASPSAGRRSPRARSTTGGCGSTSSGASWWTSRRYLHRAEGAYWVPSQHPDRARRGHGCAVLGRNVEGLEYWVPAGVYMDHWMLREGVPTPPASHLLTLPGATHLSRRPVASREPSR